jgi:succinate-acetate transporter protein
MSRNDDANVEGRVHGAQPDTPGRENLGLRLIHMLLIAFMLSISQTVLTVLTVVQFIIMLVNSGERNARLADFGTDLGIWMAKAARYQSAASDVKPWPWTDLD